MRMRKAQRIVGQNFSLFKSFFSDRIDLSEDLFFLEFIERYPSESFKELHCFITVFDLSCELRASSIIDNPLRP